MAGPYHGQVHEENLKRLEEFHQVSKKNRYRKCLVTCSEKNPKGRTRKAVSYTHLRAHETDSYLVCRLLLEKKKKNKYTTLKKKKTRDQ